MMLPSHFKVFLFNRYIALFLIVAGLGNLLLWWLIVFKVRRGPEVLILHYTTEFGVDLLGSWRTALALPAVGLVFLIGDMVLAFVVYRRYPILSYLLLIVAGVVEVMLCVAAFFIISLNS